MDRLHSLRWRRSVSSFLLATISAGLVSPAMAQPRPTGPVPAPNALDSRASTPSISDGIWWADGGGEQSFVTLHDRKTGGLVRAHPLGFHPRSSALMRDGRAVFFGRDLAIALDRFGRPVAERPGEFPHSLGGFVKTATATSDDPFLIVADQLENTVIKLNLDEFLRDPDPAGGYPPATVPWNTRITDLDPDIKRPRGIAQGRRFPDSDRPTKVWVACKGANVPSPGAHTSIVSLDLSTGAILDSIAEIVPGLRLPFGGRGVCVDTSSPDYDTIWVSCFGEQVGQPGSGHENTTGNGNQVLRIRDRNPSDPTIPPEITAIRLGRDPAIRRGPFGIACSVFGDVFIACGQSNEIWKIPARIDRRRRPNGSPLLGPDPTDGLPDPMGKFLPSNPGAVPGWPVRLPGRTGPLAIGVAGDHSVWVHQKVGNRMLRINPATGRVEGGFHQGASSPAGAGSRLIDSASTENLGDFTGYQTAAVLFPDDDANRDHLSNRASLERSVNPFVPLSPWFRPR